MDGLTHFDESDIIVGPGSKELIYLTMNVLEGKVILLSPAWPSYFPQAKLASKEVLTIHRKYENNWKLTKNQLSEELAKNKIPPKSLLVFTNPDNPSMYYFSRDFRACPVIQSNGSKLTYTFYEIGIFNLFLERPRDQGTN